ASELCGCLINQSRGGFEMTPRHQSTRYPATIIAALAGLMLLQALPGQISHSRPRETNVSTADLVSIRHGIDEEVSRLHSPVARRELLRAGLSENYGKLPLSFDRD